MSGLQAQLAQIRGLFPIVGCLQRMTSDVLGLNTTVLVLPPMVNDVLDMLSSLNSTLTSATHTIDGVNDTLTDAQSAIDAVNITSYLSMIDSVSTSLSSSTTTIQSTGLIAGMNSLQAALAVNFTLATTLAPTLKEDPVGY